MSMLVFMLLNIVDSSKLPSAVSKNNPSCARENSGTAFVTWITSFFGSDRYFQILDIQERVLAQE